MNHITELDKAQLKWEMRELYKHGGMTACFQCLYEVLVAATLLLEIIQEEQANEHV